MSQIENLETSIENKNCDFFYRGEGQELVKEYLDTLSTDELLLIIRIKENGGIVVHSGHQALAFGYFREEEGKKPNLALIQAKAIIYAIKEELEKSKALGIATSFSYKEIKENMEFSPGISTHRQIILSLLNPQLEELEENFKKLNNLPKTEELLEIEKDIRILRDKIKNHRSIDIELLDLINNINYQINTVFEN